MLGRTPFEDCVTKAGPISALLNISEVHHVSPDMSRNAPFPDDMPGPPSNDGNEPYSWIDEWLCEYVDGTMDPALEAVFTSYVEANPELKAHIEELQQTRDLLKQCRLPTEHTPTDRAQTDVCDHVESDLLCSKLSLQEALGQRPQFTAGLFVSVVAALMIGVVVGATVVGAPPSSPVATNAPTAQSPPVERPPIERGQAADRLALPATVPPLGAQSERRTPTTRAVASAESWTTSALALDSLHVPPAVLGLMRTSR